MKEEKEEKKTKICVKRNFIFDSFFVLKFFVGIELKYFVFNFISSRGFGWKEYSNRIVSKSFFDLKVYFCYL